jgi:hypothetical protein
MGAWNFSQLARSLQVFDGSSRRTEKKEESSLSRSHALRPVLSTFLIKNTHG